MGPDDPTAVRVEAGPGERRAAAAFVRRLLRLDPSAAVRLEPYGVTGQHALLLAGWLPTQVLVLRPVSGRLVPVGAPSAVGGPGGLVPGAALLAHLLGEDAGLGLAARPALGWGALPPRSGWSAREALSAAQVRALVARARTLVGPSGLAEATLDQEVVTIDPDGPDRAGVPLRLLLGLSAMGFLGDEGATLATTAGWVRVGGAYGSAVVRQVPRLSLRVL